MSVFTKLQTHSYSYSFSILIPISKMSSNQIACAHLYPAGHAKAGSRCSGKILAKGTLYCAAHYKLHPTSTEAEDAAEVAPAAPPPAPAVSEAAPKPCLGKKSGAPCAHIYPAGHAKAGTQCSGKILAKGTPYCGAHYKLHPLPTSTEVVDAEDDEYADTSEVFTAPTAPPPAPAAPVAPAVKKVAPATSVTAPATPTSSRYDAGSWSSCPPTPTAAEVSWAHQPIMLTAWRWGKDGNLVPMGSMQLVEEL